MIALVLMILGQSKQEQLQNVNMLFENDIFKKFVTHEALKSPTQTLPLLARPAPDQQLSNNPITIQVPILTQVVPNLNQTLPIYTLPIIPIQQEDANKSQLNHKDSDFKGCMLVPTLRFTSSDKLEATSTNVINVTNTVIETVKIFVPEAKKKRRKSKKLKKPKKSEIRFKLNTLSGKMKETTEVIGLAVITPTVKINLQEKRETDIDVSDIWKILESEPKQEKLNSKIPKIAKEVKIKTVENVKSNKTNALEERLKKLEKQVFDSKISERPREKKIHEEKHKKVQIKKLTSDHVDEKKEFENIFKVKPACKAPIKIYEKVKQDLIKKAKKFHTLPAKRNKGSCLVEETVIISADKDDHIYDHFPCYNNSAINEN